MKIAFIWQGFDGRYGVWRDGLWAAMQLIEKEHEVKYFDTSRIKEIDEFKPDAVLYWEAPVTILGKDSANWKAVINLPYKKYLLFAGGRIESQWLDPFELTFVESRLNERELTELGKPWMRAFGVNTQVFKPMRREPKYYDGFMQATFAGWKRHELFADALGSDGAVAGRVQEFDRNGYNRCVEKHVDIFPEQTAEDIALLINRSHTIVNTAAYWGGGQRCTLEAIACGVPVIVMSDAPKNVEYVEESGAGMVCEPSVEGIREALGMCLLSDWDTSGLDYIRDKWTERHYADAILKGIGA